MSASNRKEVTTLKRIALLALIDCFVGAQFAGSAFAGNCKTAKVKSFKDGGMSDGGM